VPPKKASFLDTNVILRFLLGDDPEQSPRATAFIRGLEKGVERSELEDCVVVETVWVLEKGFEVPRHEIARKLSSLAEISGIRYRGKRVLQDALSRFAGTTCDIADCLLAARARNRGMEVLSFDEDFAKLGCEWRKPE